MKRADSSGGSYTTIASNISLFTYTDTDVVNDKTYYYVVTAVNPAGESAISRETPITPLPPTPPTTTDNAPAGWSNHDVTVTLTAKDNGTGVAAIYYTVDGGSEQTGNSVTISAEGRHTLTYWSVDKLGYAETPHTIDVLIDKTAPTLTVVPDRTVLWPPDHRMTTVQAAVYAADGLSQIASVTLDSITSSEPDNGLGDGDQPGDIQGAEYGTSDQIFLLRAERAGKGSGRIYTITYTARDQAGNQTTATATVTVSHDSAGK